MCQDVVGPECTRAQEAWASRATAQDGIHEKSFSSAGDTECCCLASASIVSSTTFTHSPTVSSLVKVLAANATGPK